MICSLAEFGLDGFKIVLAVGLDIVSLCKTWKPISNIAVTQRPPARIFGDAGPRPRGDLFSRAASSEDL